jgi:hypothetical protein
LNDAGREDGTGGDAARPPLVPPGFRRRIEELVQEFERDANGIRALLRDLQAEDPDAFLAASVEVLKTRAETRGGHYLVALLLANDLLIPALCWPSLSSREAVALARAASQIDSMVDVALARCLADGVGAAGSDDDRAALRLMDILSEISSGQRILPWLMRVLRHSNEDLRSRAVLMIGRHSRSVRWLAQRLAESDTRVRANAVEALWDVDQGEVRDLLESAARDADNRVAGNALLGLYRLGECAAIPDILAMAGNPSAMFRSTAAWVMGESGDARFSEAAAAMLRDADPEVRKRAFWALGRIRAATPRTEPELRVSGRFPAGASKGARRLQLAVVRREGGEPPVLLPTQIIVSEGRQNVASYKVTVHLPPEPMSVVFVFPAAAAPADAPYTLGALTCLSSKRPADLWAVVPYSPARFGDTEAERAMSALPPDFSAVPEVVSSCLKQPIEQPQCTDLWSAVWRSVASDKPAARSKRYVIVFAAETIGRVAGHGLIAAMKNAGVLVQVVSTAGNPAIEEFCERVGGILRIAESAADAGHLVEQACLNSLARYSVTWQPITPDAAPVRVRVQSPAGWGETIIALPG